jgi:hypothetical protein
MLTGMVIRFVRCRSRRFAFKTGSQTGTKICGTGGECLTVWRCHNAGAEGWRSWSAKSSIPGTP